MVAKHRTAEALLDDLKAMADKEEAAGQDWNTELDSDGSGSNPEFEDADGLVEHFAALPTPRAKVQTLEPRVGEPVAEPRNTLTPLANAWMATPAPAVGICGGDLTPHLASLIGVYGSMTSGQDHRVRRDDRRRPAGQRTIDRAGAAARRSPSAVRALPAGTRARTLTPRRGAWLKTVVEGVRTQLHGGMTLAVVVTPETGWEEDQLDDVAVAGEALIILHRPDAEQEWKPRLLEPKAMPVKDAPAVPEPKVVRYQENVGPIQATPDAVWISRVPRAVVGFPTEIQGPRGEQVQCSYGMDPERYEVVKLTGWTESPGGAVEQMRLEVAPGCSVPLANFEVRLSESPVE